MKDLRPGLDARRRSHLYRERGIAGGPAGRVRLWNGREVVSFCSNDYLGLAADARVVEACARGAGRFGVGAGASCLVDGYTDAHRELEEGLAEFVGRDRALLFSTGYMANLGVVSTLAGRHSRLFEDRLNHASLIDAGLLSRAHLQRYPHRDLTHLEREMQKAPQIGDCIVASDAVFSMDGDIAPLAELAALCRRNGATLIVDDAHGFGVLGANGAGATELLQLGAAQVPVLVGTLGKAVGVFGAFVAGRAELVETLIQKARSYIYTTAMPAAVACAATASLHIVRREGWRREKLREHVALFRRLVREAGLPCLDSTTPIQGLVVGAPEQALALGAALLDDGLHVTPIRPPTVPRGTARLRITMSAAHRAEDVARLTESLARHYFRITRRG